MYDLIIEGKYLDAEEPSSIKASENLHEIVVTGSLKDLTTQDFSKLERWIENYKKNHDKVLLVKFTRDFIFALPKEKLIYSKYYSHFEKNRTTFSKLLEKLSVFNIYIEKVKDRFTPTFYGNMEEGVIKLEGEFFPNYTDIFIVPVFAWFELFLSHTPKKIRLEFWMKYFNTSASQKILEFMEILERYNKANEYEAKIFWYYLQEDKGSYGEGQLYKDDISIPFEIIEVDKKSWKTVNK